MRIEALVANSELAVQQIDALRLLIGAQLAIIMDDEGGGVYRIGESIPAPQQLPAPTREEGLKSIEQALRTRLEIKAVDALHSALVHGERAVRASTWPRLDGVADFTYANPNPRYFPPAQDWNPSWAVGLNLSMNIGDLFMSDAKGDEVEADVAKALAQRRAVEAMVINEVVTAQLDVGKAAAGLRASEISVRAAEESYRVKTDLFRVGRATTTDVIDANAGNCDTGLTIATLPVPDGLVSLREAICGGAA